MNRICAVVLLYNGRILEDNEAEAISRSMEELGITNSAVTIVAKDADAIAEALIAQEGIAKRIVITEKPESDRESIVAAVSYIGKEFSKEIASAKRTHDYMPFVLRLITEMNRDNNMCKSVEILSTTSGVIPAAIAKQYNFTEKVVNAIKSVYYNG